jgi:Ca2+-binding EF-hand superfamily protein
LFQALDQDGDGLVSQSEFEAALAELAQGTGTSTNLSKLFAELDANQDGVIDTSEQEEAAKTVAETRPGHRPPPGPPPVEGSADSFQALFQRLDQDGDGLISQSEFQAGLAERASLSGSSTGEEDETATEEASATTELESGASAFMRKLLEDFINLAQNDFYLQSASEHKGVKTYA